MQEAAFEVIQRQQGPNNSVDVRAGGLIIPGTDSATQGYYYAVNDIVQNVPLATASHNLYPRIDSIIAKVRDEETSADPDDIENDAILEWVVGVAAPTPVRVDLDASGYKNYYRLADIRIAPSDSLDIITSSAITDTRTSPPQGRATIVGGVIVCTSTTRPSSPRNGQFIYEIDTKYLRVNEGTAAAPVWKSYMDAGSGVKWTNYTPSFPLSGSKNKKYGRYFRLGNIVAGIAGFTIGKGGNLIGAVHATLPVPMTTAVNSQVAYLGAGRAFDSFGFLAGAFWSCAAEITRANPNKLVRFGTGGFGWWSTTIPFNWDDDPSDQLRMMFAYEVD
jgi:hypothetical protein